MSRRIPFFGPSIPCFRAPSDGPAGNGSLPSREAEAAGAYGNGFAQLPAKGQEAGKLPDSPQEQQQVPPLPTSCRKGQDIWKAVIPLAGFGTRVFPATKCVRKCFLPLLDTDGLLKPALLILLTQLRDAGIREIALVIGEEDREEMDRFFAPLRKEHRESLPEAKQACEDEILRLREQVTYVIQKERKGFGHAVWCTRDFADGEPVLLVLGDFVYRSDLPENCCRQVMDAYKECGGTLVSILEVAPERVVHYGILHGVWEEKETVMRVDAMVEKPSVDYAREHLGVRNCRGEEKYYATFGQYVLTPEVYAELTREILSGRPTEGKEYGLTAALDRVREKHGLYGFAPKGRAFDIGLPETYRETMMEFCR